jgi:ketosteroid isomerase-like protein
VRDSTVPGEAIELVVAGAEAATRGDADALIAVRASDVEFEPSMAGLEVDVYRGHAGMRTWMDDPHAVWDEFSGVVDDFEERADSVLVRLTVHGRARGSGIALEQHYLAPVEGAGWEALAGEELHRQAGGGAGSLRMSSSMAPGRWEPSPMRATGTADAHAKGHSARIAPPAPGAPLTAGCEAQMLSW